MDAWTVLTLLEDNVNDVPFQHIHLINMHLFVFFLVVVMIHCKAPLISRVHFYAYMSCYILTIYGLMWVWRRCNIRLKNVHVHALNHFLLHAIFTILCTYTFHLDPVLLYKWDLWRWNRSERHTECHKPTEVPCYLTFSCLYMYMVLNCCISFWLGSFFMSWSISSAMCFGRMESSRRSCGGRRQTHRGHHSSRQYTHHSFITNLTCPVSIADIPRLTGSPKINTKAKFRDVMAIPSF